MAEGETAEGAVEVTFNLAPHFDRARDEVPGQWYLVTMKPSPFK